MRGTALLALALVAARPAPADDESAQYFLGRAREALAAGDLDRAGEFLEKSAREKEGYAPTLVAMAELAKRRGRREEAVRHLDACLTQRRRDDLSAAEREAMAAAEKLLAELDEARAQFGKLVADWAAEVSRLARSAKDPQLEAECWRTILLVDPENGEAKEKLEGAAPSPTQDGPPPTGTPLFNGKDLEDWNGGPPEWTVDGGILKGRLAEKATMIRPSRVLKGDFVLACELRVKEDLGEDARCAILFGVRSLHDHFGLWLWGDSWRLERHTDETKWSDLQRHGFKRLSSRFNGADWHVYRIRVEGKRIRCYVDDRQIMDFSGSDRELDGAVGLWIQDQAIEVRKLLLEEPK